MPIENFDEEVLQATHSRPGGCNEWLMEIEKRIQMRAADANGIDTSDRQYLDLLVPEAFTQGWEELLQGKPLGAKFMVDEEGKICVY
jgi:hypothetical protein